MSVDFLSELKAFIDRRYPPIPIGGQLVTLAGQQPALSYIASTTTTAIATLPDGTAAITLLTSSGFSSLTVKGTATGIQYLSLQGASQGQTFTAIVSAAIDSRVTISITTGAAQMGALFLIAYPSILPPLPVGTSHGVAFPSASRNTGTYDFAIPTQTGFRGIVVYFGVNGGSGSITIAIQNTDLAYSPLLAVQELISGSFGNPSGGRILVYPGVTSVNNVAQNGVLGSNPRIEVVVTVAASTFEVTYDLIP